MTVLTATATGGNWTAAATWSPAQTPTAADDCLFTVTSGNVTADAGAVCRSVDCTGYIGTLTISNSATALAVGDGSGGALKFVSTMTLTISGTTALITMKATSDNGGTGWGVTTGGKQMPSVTFNGAGGKWVLQDNYTGSASGGNAIAVTAGSFFGNGKTISTGTFNSSANSVRTVELTNCNITVSGASGTTWALTTATNLTFVATGSTITISGSAANFNHGAAPTYGTVIFSGPDFHVLTASNGITFGALTRTGQANTVCMLLLACDVTVTNTFTVSANSAVNRVKVQSNVVGTTRTITAAVVSISNIVNFQDITGAGAATWTVAGTGATALGDCLGNSGITFTSSATQTWSGTTGGNWSANAWTTRVPLPQDDVVLSSAFSGTVNITVDEPDMGRNIDFSSSTGTIASLPRGSGVSPVFYGNFTLRSGITSWGTTTGSWSGMGRGSHTLTTGGTALTGALIIGGAGGTYTLQDDLNVSVGLSTVNATTTTLTANNHNVTCQTFTNNGVVNMGTGTWTLTGTATGSTWNTTSTSTVNASTSTIVFANASTNSRTFTGGGKTYNIVTYTVAGSTGALVITGANTFATLNFSDVTNARTLTFPASTTNTIGTFNVNGTSGKLMTVNSSTPGTTATLAQSGSHFVCDYLSVQDITVTGASLAEAGSHSTNVSNNSGWIFTVAFHSTGFFF